jgi:DNA-directed RNA polymerase specialized sigma24 family protein
MRCNIFRLSQEFYTHISTHRPKPGVHQRLDREHQSFQRGLQSLGARYILAIVPSLRAFAISLSDNIDRADDLVQQTLLRALANIGSFEPEKRAGLLS